MSNLAENRYEAHKSLKHLMFEERYAEALEKLSATRTEYGDHISLICDIAICHYALSNIYEWKEYMKIMEKRFFELSPQLNAHTRLAMAIKLGHFMEEDAKISEALKVYEKCLESLDINRDGEFYYPCVAQILRISVQYKIDNKRIGEFYCALTQMPNIEFNKYYRIDIEHALMLAEYFILSPQEAIQRFEKTLGFEGINQQEKALLFYDLIEISFYNNGNIPEKLLSWKQNFLPTDSYEAQITKILFTKDPAEIKLNINPSEVSLAGQLRLIIFYCRAYRDCPHMLDLVKKVSLLLSSLSKQSQNLWQEYFKVQEHQAEVEVQFFAEKRELQIGKFTIAIKANKNICAILQALRGNKEISIDEVCQKIWNSSYNDSYYHRIRMLVKRFNKSIYDKAGVEKILIANKQKVQIATNIKLVVLK